MLITDKINKYKIINSTSAIDLERKINNWGKQQIEGNL